MRILSSSNIRHLQRIVRRTCLLILGLKVKDKERNIIIDCYQPGVLLYGYQFLMVS